MNCLIVDDDPLICDLLEHYCSKIDAIDSCITTESGIEALNILGQGEFDFILLDYNLKELTGEDILKTLNSNVSVIMITSNTEFGAASYQYPNVIDFLVKPLDFGRFHQAVQRVKDQSSYSPNPSDKDSIFVKDGTRLVRIKFSDVLYLKSEANYTAIFMDENRIMTLITMKKLEEELPQEFQRIHRSYIINVNHIQSIEKGDVIVREQHLPISQKYEKELLTRLKTLN